MTRHIAVSVLGKDKPGIVAEVSKALFDTGCNIEDSSMTLLRSEFAMILLVEMPGNTGLPELEEKLSAAGKKLGLSILLRPITKEEDKKEKPAGMQYGIAVYGADKPGIVYRISSFLSKKKINITDVQTNISRGKNGPAYIMLLETDVPKSIRFNTLKKELEKEAQKLHVTVTIHPTETAAL